MTTLERIFRDAKNLERKIAHEEAKASPSRNYIDNLSRVLAHKKAQLERLGWND